MTLRTPGDPNSGCAHGTKPYCVEKHGRTGRIREEWYCPLCGAVVCHCGCGREVTYR